MRKLILLATLISITISCSAGVKTVTLRVRSRLYPSYKEEHKVKLYQKFFLADTDLQAVAVEFIPDFAIDTSGHNVISRSDTLNNPAVKVLVISDKEKKEEVWAFREGMMPHFSPKSFIGFELLDYNVGHNYKKPSEKKSNGTDHDR